MTQVTIFNRQTDIQILRNDRLMATARRYYPKITLSDEYLWDKLLASETDLQRQLRTFFQPRMCLPIWATSEEVDSYTGADPPTPVYLEPGYD
jgi:hypothetical protein